MGKQMCTQIFIGLGDTLNERKLRSVKILTRSHAHANTRTQTFMYIYTRKYIYIYIYIYTFIHIRIRTSRLEVIGRSIHTRRV